MTTLMRGAAVIQQAKNRPSGPENCVATTIDDTAYANQFIACSSGSLGGPTSTIYIDMAGSIPAIGEVVYNETPCSTLYSGGDFWYYTEYAGPIIGGNIVIQVDNNGEITNITECM